MDIRLHPYRVHSYAHGLEPRAYGFRGLTPKFKSMDIQGFSVTRDVATTISISIDVNETKDKFQQHKKERNQVKESKVSTWTGFFGTEELPHSSEHSSAPRL